MYRHTIIIQHPRTSMVHMAEAGAKKTLCGTLLPKGSQHYERDTSLTCSRCDQHPILKRIAYRNTKENMMRKEQQIVGTWIKEDTLFPALVVFSALIIGIIMGVGAAWVR